ncbi:MAG: lipid A biosynthesis acyltransferase [Gammaproteobacteria bacterium]|nr:MAG: lipid A biosynthesis acyltransferase [Gammaproteobacteria bacterium]
MKGALLRGLFWCLGHVPLRVNHALGAGLGLLVWRFSRRDRETALRNLELCFPERDAAWRRRTARASLMETGKALTEAPWLWHASPERLQAITEVPEFERVAERVAEGRGAILCSPHLGSWELTGLFAASHWPMTSLYKPPREPVVDALVKRARARTGASLVPTTAGGIRQLQAALGRGECIGILPDQAPRGGSGVFAPFFGRPAYTMTLLTRLAAERKVPVVLSFAERLPGGRGFRMHVRLLDARIHDPDPETGARVLNETIEELVRLNPAQYVWNYKRFKRRPEGMPDPYA